MSPAAPPMAWVAALFQADIRGFADVSQRLNRATVRSFCMISEPTSSIGIFIWPNTGRAR